MLASAAQRNPRPGGLLSVQPCGFPLFGSEDASRIVTADPWAYLFHMSEKRLRKADELRADAFIEQGRDFFNCASGSNDAGKPLFYYYAFLNVMKAALLIRKVSLPPVLKHGVSDPRANQRQRLRFQGQAVAILNRAADRSEFFPEVLHSLNWGACCGRTWRIVDLLAQIPSIHRTFTTVEGCSPQFQPARSMAVYSDGKHVWSRLVVSSEDRDTRVVLPVLRQRRKFSAIFSQVNSDSKREIWFETEGVPVGVRGRSGALELLAEKIRGIGVSSILTSSGYRFYLSSQTVSRFMPRLAAAYAVFFYLGSVTRYKPYDFDKIVAGKYRWVVRELLATEPNQLLYSACSWISGTEVVRPYAVID